MPSVPVAATYADLALLQSLCFDVAWLWAAAALAGVPVRARRLLGAALAAAVAETAALVLRVHPASSLPGRGLLLVGMLVLAFGLGPWRRLLRVTLAVLVAGTAISGGALLMAHTSPVAVARPGGAAPVTIAAVAGGLTLAQLGTALLLVAGTRLWRSSLRRGQTAAHTVWLEIRLGGVTAGVPALVDTGNALREPISGDPVVVAEARLLLQAGCLPPLVGEALAARNLAALPPGWQARCRYVPVRTVTGTGPGLLAIRPDDLLIRQGAHVQTLGRCWLALCRESLHPEGLFGAIVPPAALPQAAAAREAGSGPGV